MLLTPYILTITANRAILMYEIYNNIITATKISRLLYENSDAILLPDYKSSQMIQTEKRRIQCKTVKKILNWSYYEFKQIMQTKTKRYDCLIVPCTDHYTSQACSECGSFDNNMRGNKIRHCKQCVELLWTGTWMQKRTY